MDDVVIRLDYSDIGYGDTVTLSHEDGDKRLSLFVGEHEGYVTLSRSEARELADALMAWVLLL